MAGPRNSEPNDAACVVGGQFKATRGSPNNLVHAVLPWRLKFTPRLGDAGWRMILVAFGILESDRSAIRSLARVSVSVDRVLPDLRVILGDIKMVGFEVSDCEERAPISARRTRSRRRSPCGPLV